MNKIKLGKTVNLENFKNSNYLELINLITNTQTKGLIELDECWVGIGEKDTMWTSESQEETYENGGYVRTLMGVSIKIKEAERETYILITADGNINMHVNINDENGFQIFQIPIDIKIISWLFENEFIIIN